MVGPGIEKNELGLPRTGPSPVKIENLEKNLSSPDGASMIDKDRLKTLIKEKSLLISSEENFKLASGGSSNFCFDMKKTSMDPEGANLIAEAIVEILKKEKCNYIGGLESGAIPIVSAVVTKSQMMNYPVYGFFVRKKPKERGTKKLIEGNLEENTEVIILDDVTTKGESVLKAVNEIRNLKCKVKKVVTVVDRLNGARERLKDEGIDLIALYTKEDFGL